MSNGRQDTEGNTPGKRVRSTRYPRYSLQECEELATRVYELGGRHVLQETLAQDLGYSGVRNGAFKGRRAAANYFDLVTYSGDDYISLTEPWIDALLSGDQDVIGRMREEAVQKPDLYEQLFEQFADRMLPEPPRLARQLFLDQSFGIKKDAAEDAAETFWESVVHAELVDSKGYLHRTTLPTPDGEQSWDDGPEVVEESEAPNTAKVQAEDRAQREPPTPTAIEGDKQYDRLEIRLSGGRKVFLLVPEPGTLSNEDKARVTGFVNLILTPEEAGEEV